MKEKDMTASCSVTDLQERSETFLKTTGRRPRILLSNLDKNASSRRLKASAVIFADAGFDVDIAPVFSTHSAIAKMASENDVHVVGISGDHPEGIAQLKKALADMGENGILMHTDTFPEPLNPEDNPSDFEDQTMISAQTILDRIGA